MTDPRIHARRVRVQRQRGHRRLGFLIGVFVVPGLMKLKVIHKPAVPEREGINPFTKMQQTFKAKPARNVVKVRPLKALKDMVK